MAVVYMVCNKYKNTKLIKAIPAIVWLFLLMAVFATCGMFDLTSEGVQYGQNTVYSTFLPLMLCLFLLTCDARKIFRLGPKMLLSFLCTTLALLVGFTVGFLVMKNWLPSTAWQSIGATCGSFIGETINMVSVGGIYNITGGQEYTYSVVMVTVGFTVWFPIVMGMMNHQAAWNKKMHASMEDLDEIARRVADDMPKPEPPTMVDYCKLFAVGLGVTWAINTLLPYLPSSAFLGPTAWRVLIASAIGIVLGMTKVRYALKGAQEVANVFLYLSMCNTASYSDLRQCFHAPAFLVAELIMFVIMAIMLIGFSKLFHFNLFTVSVGNMANIGGTSSAPLLAAAYNPNWIAFGVLLGFFGDMLGTPIAAAFGYFLQTLT